MNSVLNSISIALIAVWLAFLSFHISDQGFHDHEGGAYGGPKVICGDNMVCSTDQAGNLIIEGSGGPE